MLSHWTNVDIIFLVSNFILNINGIPPGNYYAMNPQTGSINPVNVSPGGVSFGGGGSAASTSGKITLMPNPQ